MTATPLWNLLAWIAQVGILALAAAVVTRVIHVDAPVVRYAWWRAVLVVCLALPVIQPWRMPAPPDSGLSAPAQGPAAPTVSTSIETGSAAAPAEGVQAAEPRWTAVIAIVLVAGALLRLAWLAGGLVRLRRLRDAGVQATADAADTPDFVQSLTDAGAEVRYVPSLRQPVTFGMRRPFVLLPDMLRAMDPGVQRAVLAHELWHVKRRDWLWNLAEELLRSALWFHPAIWFLVSRVQSAREEVVDELSILSTNSRRSYLEALLAFADEPAVYPAAPFARRRQLFNRMMLISKEAVMSSRRIVASSAGMAGVLLLTGWYGVPGVPPDRHSGHRPGRRSRGAGAASRPAARHPGPEHAARAEGAGGPHCRSVEPERWLELAKLQEERGAFTDAEASYKSALTAAPGRSDLLASLAAYFNRTGQFDKAVAALEDVAAQNPTDPSGHQLVAIYYWEKAQKDQRLTPADRTDVPRGRYPRQRSGACAAARLRRSPDLQEHPAADESQHGDRRDPPAGAGRGSRRVAHAGDGAGPTAPAVASSGSGRGSCRRRGSPAATTAATATAIGVLPGGRPAGAARRRTDPRTHQDS